jgi:hypothetical protein
LRRRTTLPQADDYVVAARNASTDDYPGDRRFGQRLANGPGSASAPDENVVGSESIASIDEGTSGEVATAVPVSGNAVAPLSSMDGLTRRIQDMITRGALPRVECAASWYGWGRGERCAACDRRILGSEVTVECDIPDGGAVVLHSQCYEVWYSLVTPRE